MTQIKTEFDLIRKEVEFLKGRLARLLVSISQKPETKEYNDIKEKCLEAVRKVDEVSKMLNLEERLSQVDVDLTKQT